MFSAPLRTGIAGLLLLGTGASTAAWHQAADRWQADIQVRTLEVLKAKSGLSARVVVFTHNDDDAQNARLLVLLPVGVGIGRLAPGCTAMAGPSMVPSLRAAVTCELGTIPNGDVREVMVTTTLPPEGTTARFGVFTYSGTPDPVPGNNYAERAIP